MASNNIVVTYAILNSFRKTGRDVVECFYPLVLDCIPKDGTIGFPNELKDLIKEKYDLVIPAHPLYLIVKALKKNKYCSPFYSEEFQKYLYQLTEKGENNLKSYHKEKEIINKNIKELRDNIYEFILEKSTTNADTKISSELSRDLVIEIVQIFVSNHLIEFIDFINPDIDYKDEDFTIFKKDLKNNISTLDDETTNRLFKYIVQYIVFTKRNNSSIYEKFMDVVWGSLITATLFSKKDRSFIQNINKEIFQNMTAYLDTNIVLALFGMGPKGLCEAAKELLDYLNNFNINLKILDITFNELSNVLTPYHDWYENQEKPTPHLELYQSMKANGIKPIWLQFFFDNHTTELEKKKIFIKNTNLKGLDLSQGVLKDFLEELNILKGEKSSNKHDIMAIEFIRNERILLPHGSAKKFAEIRSFFLTSDKKLAEFNLINYGHKENQSYTEVFFDRNFMSVLWLNVQNSTPDFESIILSYLPNGSYDHFFSICDELDKLDIGQNVVQDAFLSDKLYPRNIMIKDYKKAHEDLEERKRAKIKQQEDEEIRNIPLELICGLFFILVYLIIMLILIILDLINGMLPLFVTILFPIGVISFMHTFIFQKKKK
jgi:hypothetical protein